MKLTEYLNKGKSAYHIVETASAQLKNAGFTELDFSKPFELSENGAYYVTPFPTVLFAFRINERITDGRMHIACAHTDFPCFHVKPSAQLNSTEYIRINVEPYGGMLKKTWFDRPLGVCGQVILCSDNPYQPEEMLFDSEEPWFIIPSLAPHLDREIEKKELDIQKEMMPLFSLASDNKSTDNLFLNAIADKLKVNISDILDFDLYLYLTEKSCPVGYNNTLLSAPRIDNIASCAALSESLIKGTHKDADISMIALFNNEEIGSRSKQGADSALLSWLLEKIFESALIKQYELNYKDSVTKSMLLSVDGAHGVHPNYTEKSDITSQAILGNGFVVKTSSSQRYVTDSRATAIIISLCKENNIDVQRQANRSGAPGGQTLGPIVSSYLPVLAADIGIPMLAMHSARELISSKDYSSLCNFLNIWL